jgi:hypothetical protein
MLIYPDSSDLIDLCRGGAGVKISGLAQKLFAKSHRIALSFDTLIEVAAPLRDGRPLEVRRDLNQLEELPHVFVNEGRILDTEIREALSAFEQQREYNVAAVAPFASRLDTAIDLHGAPQYVVEHMGSRPIRVQTEMIVNFRIWEIIQYVWNRDPEAFDGEAPDIAGPLCYRDEPESEETWHPATCGRCRTVRSLGLRITPAVPRRSPSI